MSVQVRRRREAASFLSTYVGAQGEILVDTTNNRVQVHDGSTPGGWPAAGIGDLVGRNVLLNGNFAVNQRGYASGASLAAGAYGHDRWRSNTGGCTYTFTQGVVDTTLTITAGTLVQIVDAPNVYAASWWLTWIGSATARVWQGSASGSYSAGLAMTIGGLAVNALLVSGFSSGALTGIEFQGGTIGLVQFEAALPNVGPTRFERRQIAQELALCQRYYEIGSYNILGNAIAANAFLATDKSFKVSKRAAPTMTVTQLAASNTLGFLTVDSVTADAARIFIQANVANTLVSSTGAWTASAEL